MFDPAFHRVLYMMRLLWLQISTASHIWQLVGSLCIFLHQPGIVKLLIVFLFGVWGESILVDVLYLGSIYWRRRWKRRRLVPHLGAEGQELPQENTSQQRRTCPDAHHRLYSMRACLSLLGSRGGHTCELGLGDGAEMGRWEDLPGSTTGPAPTRASASCAPAERTHTASGRLFSIFFSEFPVPTPLGR